MHPSIAALIATVEAQARQLAQQADTEIYEPAGAVLRTKATHLRDMADKARAELGVKAPK
jgi:hypothetical protein